jgi:hypothetical protein
MKYSDGFFVFRTENTGLLSVPVSSTVTEAWVHHGSVMDYESYTYYWMIRKRDGYQGEFYEAPVWVNSNRKLIVVFLSDYKLISEVIHAASRKFEVNLIPYSLAARTTIMNDGNLVVTNKGISDTINKVKTTLLRSDQQRAKVIESLLVGE